jgi:hypothetical protein
MAAATVVIARMPDPGVRFRSASPRDPLGPLLERNAPSGQRKTDIGLRPVGQHRIGVK